MNFLQKRLVKIASLKLLWPVLKKTRQILRAAKDRKVVIAALSQHLGDNIAAEPLDSHLRELYPDHLIVRVVGAGFVSVVSNNPNIGPIIPVSCLSEWVYLKPFLTKRFKVYDYHVHKTFCPKYRLTISNPNRFGIDASNYYNHGNLLHVFCKNSGIEPINKRPIFRLSTRDEVADLPQKFVVIQVSSNSEQREWTKENWLRLIGYFGTQNFQVVEVGIESKLNCTHPAYLNYCGKLTINQIAYTISKCNYFIGIDSAFAHFANAFNVPRLILLGHFNQFTHYLPYSGLTSEEEANTVIHHNGPVNQLPFETVKEKIQIL